MYYPSKVWLETMGINGTVNVFAIQIIGHVTYYYMVSNPDENNNIKSHTGGQEIAGSITREVSNILSWGLIRKYFLRSFSSFP